MSPSKSDIKKAKAFWDWFKDNRSPYEALLRTMETREQKEIDTLMDQFEEKIHSLDKNLWFRMGCKDPFELIITAEGDKEHFPTVDFLVSQAPEIDNWKIIPYIQPIDITGFRYTLDDFELTHEDIFFSSAENLSGEGGYFLEVMFYVKDEKFIDDDSFKSSIIRIAESAVGELDFNTIIGFIDVIPLSQQSDYKSGEVRPITEIRQATMDVVEKI